MFALVHCCQAEISAQLCGVTETCLPFIILKCLQDSNGVLIVLAFAVLFYRSHDIICTGRNSEHSF